MTYEDEFRFAAFQWLREQTQLHGFVLPRELLQHGFSHKGVRINLVGARGIWKPQVFETIPLSITRTVGSPYDDDFEDDGFLMYKYQGSDPNARDNVGLREAARTRTPLIYFHSIMRGKYVPVWPVFVIEDKPLELYCRVAVDPAYINQEMETNTETVSEEDESLIGVRRYVTAFTRQRLHQTQFREEVVHAYDDQCCLCRLHHRELLDAAHIVPDSEPEGQPVVQNGLSLCKIHHAAYDANIIGISPDYNIQVRRDILDEHDGPMLQHGLQGFHNRRIILPGRKSERPDRDRLEWRFQRFRDAG